MGAAERFAALGSALDVARPGPDDLSAPQPWGMALVHGPRPEGADAALPLGPERWLAVHEEPFGDAATAAEAHGPDAAVVDWSHGLTRIRLSGDRARALLASGVSIDLDPRAFPPGASAATAYRSVFVALHAGEDGTIDLYAPRSYAASVWEWLADAAEGTV
jgi:heterotetrameric sarcosine oxidase gamma subunit